MKGTKRFTALLLVCTMAVGLSGAALADMPEQRQAPQTAAYATKTSGKCGKNVKWKLDKTGTLTIYGTGAMKNYEPGESDSPFAFHEKIHRVVVEKGVTSIGSYAFEWSDIQNISISPSVKSIGAYAFMMCKELQSLSIPRNVEKIGKDAFVGCESLRRFTVQQGSPYFSAPNGVLLNKKKTKLLQYPMQKAGSYAIPDTVTSIADGAFFYCERLTAVTIPKGVRRIGRDTFEGCTALKRVDMLSGVTKIGECAFSGCESLTALRLGSGVTDIGDMAFSDCTSLKTVTIGGSVRSIGDMVFSGCTSLKTIRYAGNKSGWKKIKIHSDNDELKKAAIQYNWKD